MANEKPNETTETLPEDSSSTGLSTNLAEVAQDEIAKRFQEVFKGNEFLELVETLLRAEGFKCGNSLPGATGGVDALTGMGLLGMDSTKLVVQVKSQTESARSSLEGQYLNIRAQTIVLIVQAVRRHYPSLDDEIKHRLPLKKVWVPIDGHD